MAQVSLVAANLAAGFLETFFYGLFFLLYFTSTWLMAQRHWRINNPSHSSVKSVVTMCRNPLFLVGNILFILLTTHWILVVYDTFQAFIYYDGGNSPSNFYADFSTPSQIARTTIFSVSLFVADATFLYRLYVIWEGNKYIMIFPFCSFLLSLASGIAVLIFENSGSFAFNPDVMAWIIASTVGTLCTNISACAFIAWKLWRVHQVSQQHFGGSSGGSASHVKSLLWTASVLVESAALYAGWTVLYVATYSAGSNLEFPVSDAWLPITGISFMLINVRVGLGYTTLHSAAQEESTDATVSRWGIATRATEVSTEMSVLNDPGARPIGINIRDLHASDEENKTSEMLVEIQRQDIPV